MSRKLAASVVTLATAVSLLTPLASASAATPSQSHAVAAVQSVSRAVSSTVNWDLDNPQSYGTMIINLRQAATEGTEGGVAVTYPRTDEGLIAVNITGVGRELTLYFTRNNLYLRGFGLTNGDMVYGFNDWPLQNHIDVPGYTPLSFGSSYIDLQHTAGTNRAGFVYGTESLQQDLRTLTGFAPGGNNAQAARALLRLISATSEAARFNPIEVVIGTAINNHHPATLTPRQVSMENEWGSISAYGVAQAEHHPANPVTFNGVTFNSMRIVAAWLALMLRPGTGS
ncbi:ribosome-inactivating family protein [Kitasatospora sp. McL0602]|uniref:ribosome-inactivating family protein n=1 Tax=Kitasatospora sp. McL0602 TaxID=3439530 RepID=UPI003F88C1ED